MTGRRELLAADRHSEPRLTPPRSVQSVGRGKETARGPPAARPRSQVTPIRRPVLPVKVTAEILHFDGGQTAATDQARFGPLDGSIPRRAGRGRERTLLAAATAIVGWITVARRNPRTAGRKLRTARWNWKEASTLDGSNLIFIIVLIIPISLFTGQARPLMAGIHWPDRPREADPLSRNQQRGRTPIRRHLTPAVRFLLLVPTR
jgi:hypothetical protein